MEVVYRYSEFRTTLVSQRLERVSIILDTGSFLTFGRSSLACEATHIRDEPSMRLLGSADWTMEPSSRTWYLGLDPRHGTYEWYLYL